MIKSLALTNFKSIGKTLIVDEDGEPKEGKLDFAPLTIFCGKNSSGKSSVLQSILLLSQTLQNNLQSHRLILNGPIVNLGNVDDIKSVFSNSNDITIDIGFNVLKPIKEKNEYLKFKPLINCIEEVISIKGYQNPFTYYMSSNIDDIIKMIYVKTDNKIDLNNVSWRLNPNLSQLVKDSMNKNNLDYSMTIYTHKGWKYLAVNKRINTEWYYIGFTELNGVFLSEKEFHELYDIASKSSLMKSKTTDPRISQDINLSLSFYSKGTGDISSIIPIIKEIKINNEFLINYASFSTYFSAINIKQPKEIITKDRTYEFYKINIDEITKSQIKKISNKDDKLVGLYLDHFLPTKFAYVFSKSKFNSDVMINYLYKIFITDLENGVYQFKKEIIKTFNESIKIIIEYLIKYLNMDKNIFDYYIPDDINIDNKQVFMEYVNNIITQLNKKEFKKLFSKALHESIKNNNKNINQFDEKYSFPYTSISKDLGFSLENSVECIKDCFKNKILYIGPLREDPRLQYDYYIDNTKDMGIKGEKCSGILENSKDKLIKYIHPNYFKQNKHEIKKHNIRLIDALNNWLKYIEIADSVSTTFFGRFGYVLRIKPLGRKGRDDLTNVGVGVSQILPILLLCLLADEGTTIIIEQPELHLHPAMQSKLTDFFIATMSCNKQLIIETHSEHIINRLRLRAINCQNETPIKYSLTIYFTENLQIDYKDYKKGNTIFKPLKINEYAAVSDWPDGFLDEASKTADEIINAASIKWKKEKDNT